MEDIPITEHYYNCPILMSYGSGAQKCLITLGINEHMMSSDYSSWVGYPKAHDDSKTILDLGKVLSSLLAYHLRVGLAIPLTMNVLHACIL